MARMMRANRWVKVVPWYYTDFSGDHRAQEKRAVQAEIDEAQEEIDEDRRRRECWNTYYSLFPAEFADHVLDMYGVPKPPSRERRTPG